MNRLKNYLKVLHALWFPSDEEARPQRWSVKLFRVVFPLMFASLVFNVVFNAEERRRQSDNEFWWVGLVVVLVAAVVVAYQLRRQRDLLKQPDADRLVALLHKQMSGNIFTAQTSQMAVKASIIYSIYGRFDAARQAIESVPLPADNPATPIDVRIARGLLVLMAEGDAERARSLFLQGEMQLRRLDLLSEKRSPIRFWIALTELIDGSATDATREIVKRGFSQWPIRCSR